MTADSLITELQDKNNEKDISEIKDGHYIFKTYQEMEGFIKLVIG